MGLESFQGRTHDMLAKGPPSYVSTSADRSLEQNENDVLSPQVPDYLATVPAALLKDTEYESHEAALNHTNNAFSLLPPLTKDATDINGTVQVYNIHPNTPKILPQNMPQYSNVFNERARRGFCYWLVEKKGSTYKGYSLGAYKTFLGLPKV